MSIGDVNSAARGSGARYNAGKPAVELIPLRLIAESLRDISCPPWQLQSDVWVALRAAGEFQETGSRDAINDALRAMAGYWGDCARVFDYGRRKYAAWNWAKGMAWSVPLACIGRHALAKLGDFQDIDPESGERHEGHILCNLVMLATYIDTYPEGNDLPPPEFFKTAAGRALDSVSMDPPPIVSEEMAEAIRRDIILTRAESDDDTAAYDAKPLGRALNPPSNDEE